MTTIGVKAVLIAKQSLSDDVIKNVTKTIYEHADDLSMLHLLIFHLI